jgi:2-polyprenyl-3-methyl-5-hydroxy-6-metoxy-1,4-benzoquinol methylase
MTSAFEDQILNAWESNAKSWVDAVNNQGIRSPGSITHDALLAVLDCHISKPSKILDVGCGEGWLVQTMVDRGHEAVGVDTSSVLIEHAKHYQKGTFWVANQGSLSNLRLGQFDLMVCNFSLFGDKPVTDFFASLPALLRPGGVCIIQTLHPSHFEDEGYYCTGWRKGTWAGLPGVFSASPPLFTRTLENWWKLFHGCGLRLIDLSEPSGEDGIPKSIIFIVGL